MSKDLQGELEIGRLVLRNFIALDESAREMIFQWRNDDRIRSCMLEDEPIPPEAHRLFMKGLSTRSDCLHYLCFQEGEPVGVVNLNRISLRHRRASWGIYRRPDVPSSDSGLQMGGCVLEVAFDRLRLHTLQSEILAFNRAALLLNQALGFRKAGLLRDYVLHRGRFVDLLLMNMTAEEYFRLSCE